MKVSPGRVRMARHMLGLNQDDLADTLGCSTRTVNGWERGENGVTPRLLRQLSMVTGVSVPWLLGEEESNGQHRQDP